MTLISIAISVLYGVALAGNHQMALNAAARFSRKQGRIYWALVVALPLAIMLVLIPTHALIGLVVAIVLSYVVRKVRQRAQAKAKRCYTLVSC